MMKPLAAPGEFEWESGEAMGRKLKD
jgi:hypothetical protein